MSQRLQGAVALVTGAGGGIGRATALAFAREGAKVAVVDVAEELGDETVSAIQSERGEAVFVKCDVTQPAEVEAMVRQTVERFGRLDCACNNAGIEGAAGRTAECSEENWDRVIAINLKGVWLSMKYEIQQMMTQGRGAIVNIASVAGIVGWYGAPGYTAAKHGVVGLTKVAALEYAATGIRVNAVCPGVIETPMLERLIADYPGQRDRLVRGQPIGRVGKPEEIASAVVWLCSDESSFAAGHSLVVDGGYVAR